MKRFLLAALAAVPTGAVAQALDQAIADLDARSDPPIFAGLSSSDRRLLEAGESITRSGWADGAFRVSGLRVVDAPRDRVWAAVHDPRVVGDPSVKELRLSAEADGTELWYGRMILPLGLTDRHWVVRSRVHVERALATSGRAWERAWSELSDGLDLARPAIGAGHLHGVTAADLDDAIATPVNRGAWLVAELPDGRALLATHATTDLGGTVPAWMVRDVARRQLAQVLERVARASDQPHPDVVPGGPT
jgi:hypothetical protein